MTHIGNYDFLITGGTPKDCILQRKQLFLIFPFLLPPLAQLHPHLRKESYTSQTLVSGTVLSNHFLYTVLEYSNPVRAFCPFYR